MHEGIDPDIIIYRVFAQFNDKPDKSKFIKFVASHMVVGISPVKQFKAAPNVVSVRLRSIFDGRGPLRRFELTK
jgi:hypothetical protein